MRTDFFGLSPRQHDMFGAPEPASDIMTNEEIRRELAEVLDLLRASEAMPWQPREMMMIANMFPDLARRLPAIEADELIAQFEGEMQRLRRDAA